MNSSGRSRLVRSRRLSGPAYEVVSEGNRRSRIRAARRAWRVNAFWLVLDAGSGVYDGWSGRWGFVLVALAVFAVCAAFGTYLSAKLRRLEAAERAGEFYHVPSARAGASRGRRRSQ